MMKMLLLPLLIIIASCNDCQNHIAYLIRLFTLNKSQCSQMFIP